MATVLWGARSGDVQYASREFWRRNIPIDPRVRRLGVESADAFDVGCLVDVFAGRRIVGIELLRDPPPLCLEVVGIERGPEGPELGVKGLGT